jgi:NAD-dependent dihydropyrimidine dehydrogenase PreA subunit
MSHVISDKCTKCGNCVAICPQDAIKEGDKKYVIDPDKCVDCGLCKDECPVSAISEG